MSSPNGDITSPNGDFQAELTSPAAVGERIRQASENAGLNQRSLADAAGCSPQVLNRYWRGERLISTEMLLPIVDALNVDVRWLLTGRQSAAWPRFNVADAERVNAAADRSLEAGDDGALAPGSPLRTELEAVSRSEGLADRLRNRADYILEHLGDSEAGKRRAARVRRMERERDEARRLIHESLDRAIRAADFKPGDAAETAILALCNQLLLFSTRSMEPDALDWPLQQLLRAFAPARVRGAVDSRQKDD